MTIGCHFEGGSGPDIASIVAIDLDLDKTNKELPQNLEIGISAGGKWVEAEGKYPPPIIKPPAGALNGYWTYITGTGSIPISVPLDIK